MTTNVDLTNRALALIGTRSQITSMAGSEQEAKYANILYNPLRDMMLTENDYDFSMDVIGAIAAAAPPPPWTNAYTYPAAALRIRTCFNSAGSDPYDVSAIEFNIRSNAGVRTIVATEAITHIVFTYAAVEDIWTPIFTDAFCRMLGSALAYALENRMELSQNKMAEAINFARAAAIRTG